MINVSSQFKEELNKGNRNYLAYVDITLKDGTKLNLDSSKIWSNSFCIEDNVSNPSTFDIGSAIINKGSFALNNIYEDFSRYDFDGARVHMAVGLKLSDGRIEKVNFGYYNVSETRYNGSIITLECLDDMTKFDKKYSLSTLRYPATLMEIVDDACRVCNVSNGMISFNNSGYVVNERPSDEALTCRQVLAWVGQIACEWFKMDTGGRLTHGWYDKTAQSSMNVVSGGTFKDSTVDSISGGTLTDSNQNVISGGNLNGAAVARASVQSHMVSSLNSMNIATDDVVITGLKIDEYDKASQEKVVSHLEGVEGYVLHIQNNKLIQKGQAQVVGQLIGQRVIGLRFRPLNVTFQSDPTIEAGDSATVVDYKGNAYETFVTGMKFTAGSSQMIECGAETAQRNSADRFSQATQGYIEAHKEIEKEKTDREKAMQALNDTLAASSGMYVTEEVQPDGSTITYLHDKPTKAESKNVIKITADAVGISNDGGKTYPYGLFLTGDVITRILYAHGINAEYVTTGILRDKAGKNYWNLDTGEFQLIGAGGNDKDWTPQINQAEQNAINQANQALTEYANTVSRDMQTLQNQVDGQVEDWYYDYQPTTSNVPASNWTTEAEKEKHVGDRFFWKSKGYAYRWMKNGYYWEWVLLKDTDITTAMKNAQDAKDVADGKRRTFITQPTPPYDAGDLWCDGTDIKTCTTSKAAGQYYSSWDWEKLNGYTDDTVANQALQDAQNPDKYLTQLQVFNKLTNNGALQGIFMQNGQLYINGAYIQANSISGDKIQANSIVASKLNVTDLSAITAKLGKVYSADITNQSQKGVDVFRLNGNRITFFKDDAYDNRELGGVWTIEEVGGEFGTELYGHLFAQLTSGNNYFRIRPSGAYLYANDIFINNKKVSGLENYGQVRELWAGESMLDGSVKLSENISAQPHGIVLLFSGFNPNTVEAGNWWWQSHFIPKSIVTIPGPYNISLVGGNNGEGTGRKTISFDDTNIYGSVGNDAVVTNNGIRFENNRFILRKVYGV